MARFLEVEGPPALGIPGACRGTFVSPFAGMTRIRFGASRPVAESQPLERDPAENRERLGAARWRGNG